MLILMLHLISENEVSDTSIRESPVLRKEIDIYGSGIGNR